MTSLYERVHNKTFDHASAWCTKLAKPSLGFPLSSCRLFHPPRDPAWNSKWFCVYLCELMIQPGFPAKAIISNHGGSGAQTEPIFFPWDVVWALLQCTRVCPPQKAPLHEDAWKGHEQLWIGAQSEAFWWQPSPTACPFPLGLRDAGAVISPTGVSRKGVECLWQRGPLEPALRWHPGPWRFTVSSVTCLSSWLFMFSIRRS